MADPKDTIYFLHPDFPDPATIHPLTQEVADHERRTQLANMLEDVFHDTVDNFPIPVGGITFEYSKASHAAAWLAVVVRAEEEFAPGDTEDKQL